MANDRALCVDALPKVSRTFAVCIRLLPPHLEYSVLVAYLLCRIADTFEDTPHLSTADRERFLGHLSASLEERAMGGDLLRDAFPAPATDEQALVAEAAAVLREFHRLPQQHREAIRPWVQEMCVGMAEFAARKASGGGLHVLATVQELERYCYYVAGTVGQLLTALFRSHDRDADPGRYGRLEALATSFGLGLQLTNIIKDVADDRRRGWSFVPRQLCQRVGIEPEDLQSAGNSPAGRRVMQMLIDKAKAHLDDALEYSVTVPRRHSGIRQFCLASLYFAVRTLRVAEHDVRLLDPQHRVKITRREVWRTVRMTRVVARSDTLVRWYFRVLAGNRWARRPAIAPV
jgi:farnesyl-diphosphate farnesyltransferase